MSTVKVRCWKINNGGDEIFITYPEGNAGHELITCLNCGQVYCVNVAKRVYIGPSLPEKLAEMTCINCKQDLAENWAYYPETYVVDGSVKTFERPSMMPDDSESLVKEFPEIYS